MRPRAQTCARGRLVERPEVVVDKTHEGRLHEAQNITDLAQATIYAMDRDSAIGKGRLRRLFLNGPAHCTQVIAKA